MGQIKPSRLEQKRVRRNKANYRSDTMVHEWRVKHAYLQCTENTPRFRGIEDGEKRTEHICALNKLATVAKRQQRYRRRHEVPVHCEMFNLALTLNSNQKPH